VINTIVTYIYPGAKKFFPDFIETLQAQTNQNFDVIVFNDGVVNADLELKKLHSKIQIIDLFGSIANIRYQSLEILKRSKYEYFIFQDIDDCMSENRVEVVLEGLTRYPLVCNDLDLLKQGEVLKRNVWKKRLGQEFEFDHNFLTEKNIVGFGNTAIKKELLNFNIKKSSLPIAVDWFIFYQLIFFYCQPVLFTGNCTTKYRQHEDNLIGLMNKVSLSRITLVLKVKFKHYLALKEFGVYLKNEIRRLEYLKNTIQLNKNNVLPLESKKVLFWWEETNYL
jgi:hypothetical protein